MDRIIFSWLATQQGGAPSPAGGTMTSVAIDDFNGFWGTVSNPNTDALIKIKVTVQGLIYGNSDGSISGITPVDNAVMGTNGSGIPSFITTLPAVNTGATLATNPKTSSIDNLNDILQTLYTESHSVGTVTDFIFTDGSGFLGAVTSGTTTPTLSLTTSVTGILKGVGGALTQATAGSDYVIPSGSVAFSTTAGSATTATTAVTATNANNLLVTLSTDNTSFDIALVPGASTQTKAFFTAAGLTYNPSTTTLSGNFNGPLVGNATSATTSSNVFGGIANSILYQSAANMTTTLSPAIGIVSYDGTELSYLTAFNSSYNVGLALATNPYSSTQDNVNAILNQLMVDGHGTGTVTSFTFPGGNGFFGTVATGSTTPALTLYSSGVSNYSTTITSYFVGNMIRGDGVNGNIGSLYTCNTNTSGTFNPSSWTLFTANASGIGPYSSSDIYNKGSFISGDGTNGVLGGLYVCIVNGTTGTFNISNWAADSVIDLTNLSTSKINTYLNTYTLPLVQSGTGNTLGGQSAGSTPSMSGNYNTAYGFGSLRSNSAITGSFNTSWGGASSGGGNLTSASFMTNIGYGAGLSTTTATYINTLGYNSGSDLDTATNVMILGGYTGVSGTSLNNSIIISDVENGNIVVNIASANSAPSANTILASPIGAAGALGIRAINPSYTTTLKNALSGMPAGTVVFDSTLVKLCVWTGSAWQTITSV